MIEALESRIAPAGVVEVILKGGALSLKTVSGDGDENVTITSSGPGLIRVDPDAATTLRFNGSDLAPDDFLDLTGVIKGVTIGLGAGNDTVDFQAHLGGKLSVDLGAGNNTFTLRPSSIAGDVAIKGGAGDDTVRSLPVDGGFAIAGRLMVALGDGTNHLALSTSGVVGRDVLVTSGAGDDSLRIDGPHSFAIGGSLIMLSGAGADTIAVNIGDTLSVKKNLSFVSKGGATVGQTITSQRGPTVGGKVTFAGAADTLLTQSISASALQINLGGAVSFTGMSNGAVSQTITASAEELTVAGALSFKAQGSQINQTLDGARLALNSVKMAATLTAAFGIPHEDAPEAVIPVNTAVQRIISDVPGDTSASSIKGPVTLTGADTVSLGVVGEIRGPVTIKLRTSANESVALGVNDLNFTSRFLGPVKITMGAGLGEMETVLLASSTFAGPVTILGSGAASTFTLLDSTFFGSVMLAGNDGNDVVNWDVGSLSGRDGRALGAVKIFGGTGTDTVNLGGSTAADAALFLGPIGFDGGADADALNLGSAALLLLTPQTKNVP